MRWFHKSSAGLSEQYNFRSLAAQRDLCGSLATQLLATYSCASFYCPEDLLVYCVTASEVL